jgi:uncharacterized protein (DUF2267 family)
MHWAQVLILEDCMNEIISRIAAAAGVSEETALEAVTVILNFLKKDGPQEQVDKVIAALPGAENLVTAEERGGGMLGGMLGGAMGAMGALNKLTSAGLDMGEIQTVTRELVTVAREHAGDEVVDQVIDGIPGLSQIV